MQHERNFTPDGGVRISETQRKQQFANALMVGFRQKMAKVAEKHRALDWSKRDEFLAPNRLEWEDRRREMIRSGKALFTATFRKGA